MMTRKGGMALLKPIFILTVVCIAHWICPVRAYELHSRRGAAAAAGAAADQVQHRFKSFDRIRHRLDRNSNNQLASTHKELLHPGLPTVYNNSSTSAHGAAAGAGLDGRGTRGTRLLDTTTRLKEPQDFSEIDSEDLDEEEAEDSYEDEEDEELLADKTSWPWNGYSSYGKHHGYHRSKVPTYPQTTTTTTTTTTAPPISYSQYKWQNLGTRQGVEQYRRNSLGNSQRHYGSRHYNGRPSATVPDTPNQDAINHALRVLKEGNCGVPKPRLVRVQDFYPHPGITYVPHCTILHQCSDDTGCCRHEVLTCSPKTTQRVELAFYTYTSGSSRNSATTRLTFYNHTECECRDRMDDIMPRDMSSSVSLKTGGAPAAGVPMGQNNLDPLSAYQYHSGDHKTRNPQCKCSSAFAERVLPDGSCSCDCFDKQKECLRLKRGKDFFSMQDKWCIQTGRCEIPVCAYGPYIHIAGRCPRKKDRSSPPFSWQRYMSQ